MRVGRQPAAGVADLLAEAVELVLGQPALEEGAGVDAGGGVALEPDLVAAAGVVLAAEEVVEADLVQRRGARRRRRCGRRRRSRALRPVHHDRGVPADVGADAALDVLVAREPRLALRRDRVDVVGAAQRGDADLLLAAALEQPEHQVAGAVAAGVVDDGVEGVQPLLGLVGIGVGELAGQPVGDDRAGRAGVAGGVAVRLLRCAHVSIVSRRAHARHAYRWVVCRVACARGARIARSGPSRGACVWRAMPYASANGGRCDGSAPHDRTSGRADVGEREG